MAETDSKVETVTIPKSEYETLCRESFKLQCLESGGVDNWEWYSDSLQEYFEKYEVEL